MSRAVFIEAQSSRFFSFDLTWKQVDLYREIRDEDAAPADDGLFAAARLSVASTRFTLLQDGWDSPGSPFFGSGYELAVTFGDAVSQANISSAGRSATASADTAFNIVIRYTGDPLYQSLFDDAARRWAQIIIADLPDVFSSRYGAIDDLLIDASVVPIDGQSGILAQAGPDEFLRGTAFASLPDHGTMEFDSADVGKLFDDGRLGDVILHEMCHVLGLGTLWAGLGLLSGFTYIGAGALAEYRILTGNPNETALPAENFGGPGSVRSHWRETVFNEELMTSVVEQPGVAMPISRLTIASLNDIGYQVNLAEAEPYSLRSDSAFRSLDFDGDRIGDILWRNDGGSIAVWEMDGLTPSATGIVGFADASWHIRGTGDFNADRRADILWQDDAGSVAVWEIDGFAVLASGIAGFADPSWHVRGAGDFNADAMTDILWQNDAGNVAIWEMNGLAPLATGDAGFADASWHITGADDFNGDGMADILWQNDGGSVAIWEMNGLVTLATGIAGFADPSWHVRGTGDFNGDRKADILWQNDNGSVAVWEMDGLATLASGSAGFADASWHIRGTPDVNGDRISDILWQNDGGSVVAWLMNGLTPMGSGEVGFADASWHIVDGDVGGTAAVATAAAFAFGDVADPSQAGAESLSPDGAPADSGGAIVLWNEGIGIAADPADYAALHV